MPTYVKIRAGLYRHRSGRLILRTEQWEGPRGGDLSRWEHASEDQGNIVIDGYATYTTLREVAALDVAEERESSVNSPSR